MFRKTDRSKLVDVSADSFAIRRLINEIGRRVLTDSNAWQEQQDIYETRVVKTEAQLGRIEENQAKLLAGLNALEASLAGTRDGLAHELGDMRELVVRHHQQTMTELKAVTSLLAEAGHSLRSLAVKDKPRKKGRR